MSQTEAEKSEQVLSDGASTKWWTLAILLMVVMVHYLDRQVITLIQELIKREFSLSDSALGLVTGTAYAVSFAIAGVPLGMLIDRVHRVRLLSVLVLTWSGLTVACGFATSYAQLFAARMLVGAAESGGTPANLSLISDYFKDGRRSIAVGIYMAGPNLATLVGFVFVGMVAANFGWRAALWVAGAPGFLLVIVLLLFVREPPRERVAEKKQADWGAAFRDVLGKPSLFHLVSGLTIANVMAPGVSAWVVSLLMRSHGVDIGTAAMSVAFAMAPFGVVGSIAGGFIADRLGARGAARVLWLMMGAAFLTMPLAITGALADNYWVAIVALGAVVGAHMMLTAPGYALALSLVSPNARGTLSAILGVLANLLGYGVGPLVGGVLSDGLRPAFGEDSLRYAMALFALLNIWTMVHFWLARQALRREAADPA